MFIKLRDKFIQNILYQILSVLAKFCITNKNIWLAFFWHMV